MNPHSVSAEAHATKGRKPNADMQLPSEFITSMPLSDFTAAQRDTMSRFCRQMEMSLKVNKTTGELGVHVPALKDALSTYCSSSFVDQTLRVLEQTKDQPKLLSDGTLPADWVSANWSQLQKVANLSSRDQVLKDLGLPSAAAKPAEWKNALTTKFPEMADSKFTAKFQSFMRSDAQKDTSGTAWVQCLVRNLGWWAVFVVIWALVAFLLSITPGGQISWGLWGILVACGVGVGMIGVMIHCAENPNG